MKFWLLPWYPWSPMSSPPYPLHDSPRLSEAGDLTRPESRRGRKENQKVYALMFVDFSLVRLIFPRFCFSKQFQRQVIRVVLEIELAVVECTVLLVQSDFAFRGQDPTRSFNSRDFRNLCRAHESPLLLWNRDFLVSSCCLCCYPISFNSPNVLRAKSPFGSFLT